MKIGVKGGEWVVILDETIRPLVVVLATVAKTQHKILGTDSSQLRIAPPFQLSSQMLYVVQFSHPHISADSQGFAPW